MILDRILFGSHLQDGEELVYVVHSHWFAAYKPVCKVGFFGMIVPVLLFAMFPTTPALIAFGSWFVLGFIRFLYEVVDWYFDVLLITDKGIVDLDWRGIFDKSSARVDYQTVVGVNYDKVGFWSTMLNFGRLEVEKEGHGDEHIALPIAAKPQQAEQEILGARERSLHQQGLEDQKVLREILSGMVKSHVRGGREKGEKLADII